MPTINLKKHKQKQITYTPEPTLDFSSYYNSRVWKLLRNKYFTEHPLCEDCLENGITTPAVHVHHIIPFSTGRTDQERYDLLTDENNLKSLCLECHHKYHIPFKRI